MFAERLRRSSRLLVAPVHDQVIAALSLPLAIGLRVGFDKAADFTTPLLYFIPFFCLVTGVVFARCGIYHHMWRFTSFGELRAMLKGIGISIFLFVLVIIMVDPWLSVPRSVPMIQALCLIVLLGAPRCLRRAVHDASPRPQKADRAYPPIPILLVGSGDGATLLIRALERKKDKRPYCVIGIVEFSDEHVGRQVLGVPVLGTLDRLGALLSELGKKEHAPQRIVLTSVLSRQFLLAVTQICSHMRIPLSRLPSLTHFRDAASDNWLEFQPIAVEDLLSRPQVSLDETVVSRFIEGRRVLVTGAGGSIGAELSRQISRLKPKELTLVDFSEYNLYAIDIELDVRHPQAGRRSMLIDIRDRERVRAAFQEVQPELVFHAAALKHVPIVELNPLEGVRTNVFGTRNIAEAARDVGAVAFIQVSSDKAVNPTSVMGATKCLAERLCQALDIEGLRSTGEGTCKGTRFVTVRFGNVLGSSGSVVPLFQKQIARGGPITVTHPDVTRYFMTISEAVELVLHASASAARVDAERGRVFILNMGEPIRVVDVAEQMIRLAGLQPYQDIDIQFIGLRPGEKLYEELLDRTDTQLPSPVPGVLAVQAAPIELAQVETALSWLDADCRMGQADSVIRTLADQVPGYMPQRAFVESRPRITPATALAPLQLSMAETLPAALDDA